MGLNATTYSGRQFKVFLASEQTTGTFCLTDASFYRVDVEGITLPPFSPVQEFEMRTGSGRIAEFDQIFSSSKRVTTEFTLTGRLTQEMWMILMENVTGDEFDGGTGGDSVLTLANDYGGLGFKVGDDPAGGDSDWAYLLSVYFAAPNAADSYSLKSCTCTSFSIARFANRPTLIISCTCNSSCESNIEPGRNASPKLKVTSYFCANSIM